ncbi:MAG TPA: hypothetical protein PKC40_13070 [Saprospiraceae bacterium]|nr:hypothetical protein [Saprospiraceae bacterium]
MKFKNVLFAILIGSALFSACKSDSSASAESGEATTEGQTTEEPSKPKSKEQTILGNWRDVDDAKSIISIAGSRYFSIYDGKLISEETMEFHEKCPESCQSGGDVSGNSCFTTNSTDGSTCYVIVKLSEEELQLTMAGGTGKTLTYRRLQ